MKQYILHSTHSSSVDRTSRRRSRSNAEAADWNELLSLSESNDYRLPQSTTMGITPLYRLDDLSRLNGVLYAKIA